MNKDAIMLEIAGLRATECGEPQFIAAYALLRIAGALERIAYNSNLNNPNHQLSKINEALENIYQSAKTHRELFS
jgi:hypothetical protein